MILEIIIVGQLETNCYIVGDEDTNDVIVIDPGDEGERIYNIISQKGYKVKYIILTHGHIDHISAVKYLKEKTEAKVAIHQMDSEALTNSKANLSTYMGLDCIQVPADMYLEDNAEIVIGKHIFKIIHTPGHTQGGICLLADGTLFSGDTLFLESIGRTDLPGGDHQQLLDSIRENLMTLEDRLIVYPGHWDKTDIGHERAYNPFIR